MGPYYTIMIGALLFKAAAVAAMDAGNAAIAVDGQHVGQMARRIAKFRPTIAILARVTDPKECRQLMLNRGILETRELLHVISVTVWELQG